MLTLLLLFLLIILSRFRLIPKVNRDRRIFIIINRIFIIIGFDKDENK